MRWGLIPNWAKDASIGVKAINAMAETAAEKPMFREAMRKRRCLIPADGFYEWKQAGSKSKQPFNIGLVDDSLFAFAGLWDSWRNAVGNLIETCTILTTRPNALTQDIHNRMPVILSPEDYDLWLDPGVTDSARVQNLLKPFDARQMRTYPVSSFVNKVDNDGPECAEEISLQHESVQQKLF
jgi:putative SOS response-associated peptidase YedK